VEHDLCHRTDRLVGIIQCGNEFLMSSKTLPVTPLHMASKQVQEVSVSNSIGMIREPSARQTTGSCVQALLLSIYVLLSFGSHDPFAHLHLPHCIGKSPRS